MSVITYDETAIATPGIVHAGLLGLALSDALDPIVATATFDLGAAVGSQIRVTYSQALAGGEPATALAIVNAHDGNTPTVGKTKNISPAPSSNAWTDVEGGGFSVQENQIVSGSVSLFCYVGTSLAPCGTSLAFAASREVGESVRVESWGLPGGRVAKFQTRLEAVSSDRIALQLRRQGATPVRARVSLDLEIEDLP